MLVLFLFWLHHEVIEDIGPVCDVISFMDIYEAAQI